MRILPTRTTLLAAGLLGALCVPLLAGAQPVVIETVPVGNPGNAGEQSRLSNADPTFYGEVAYPYRIARYEVTAGQYTAFLNAVAAIDTHNLYDPRMDYDADPTRAGCNIKRHGAPGSFTYSVAPDWANRPVNYVSWADAVRFANWLHNGQPSGVQDPTTTEDGSYLIDGIPESDDTRLEDVVRKPDATWVIPTDDEWYKAAYHKNDGVTGNYWNFPTGADGGVSNQLLDPDPGNHATFFDGGVFTIGAPYFRTEIGAHESSASPYGTFDQGGNVMEFTETVPEPDIRRIRGGSWQFGGFNMFVSEVDDVMHSSDQFRDLGFRLAKVGEPDPPACDDGIDNDGDGAVDFPDDPGCVNPLSKKEDPQCSDGVDNDGDGRVDSDGGGVGDPDPQCAAMPFRDSERGCGLGAELALVFAVLRWRSRRPRPR